MIRLNDNVFQFEGLENLNSYSANKYGNNSIKFNSKLLESSIDESNARIFSISFNKLEKIHSEHNDDCFISISDIKSKSNEVCVVLGALNNKKSDLSKIFCYSDGNHVFITTSKFFQTIELAIMFIDREKCPGYMNILYDISRDFGSSFS